VSSGCFSRAGGVWARCVFMMQVVCGHVALYRWSMDADRYNDAGGVCTRCVVEMQVVCGCRLFW
jgi:hypothetical protein